MAASANGEWRKNKSVVQCNRYMLENEIECDVKFLVGREGNVRMIHAHKYMLMSRSQVFFSMLAGLMAETGSQIVIPDIDPDIFKAMLLYIYCEDTRIGLEQTFELLYAAKKYDLDGLAKRCVQKMRTGVSSENVCMVLEQADLFNDEETKQLCLQYIFHNSANTFNSPGFYDLPADCLKQILVQHRVNLKEEKIFEAVHKWAENQCRRQNKALSGPNKRQVLGDILDFIRFPRMEPAYFTDKVSHMGLLNDEQLVTNFRFFLTKKADPADPPRVQRVVIHRFHGVLSGKGYFRDNSDAITFILNQNAKLHEVLVYGSCQNEGMYKITLQIKEDGDRVLHEKTTTLKTDGCTKIYPVNIEPPLRIEGEKCYTLDMKMKGPASFFGRSGESILNQEDINITFIPNPVGLNGTNINQGQFPGLVFEKI